ncbi:MAG: type I asparaginase [Caldithrix sp.]|nr:type I asparaginase [Caldithrix sp.]
MKNILLIGLGGTIACFSSEEGLVPKYSPEYLLSQESKILKIAKIKTTRLMVRTIVYPRDWIKIAKFIAKSVNNFDGFVITMGTDTLAYTSSMLSFMLLGIDKPVIITGAMIPIEQKNSDAKKNLADSVVAACEPIAGVYVVFNGKLIKGCRASKVNGNSLAAFESINFPHLAEIDNGKINYRQQLKKNENKKLVLDLKINTSVITVKLNPQLQKNFFKQVLDYKAFVIEGYGDGNISDNLITVIVDLIKDKKIVVIASQCPYGRLDHKYKGGYLAIKSGSISSKDMTKESALTKLMWCMGRTRNLEKIKELMYKNICGEIS